MCQHLLWISVTLFVLPGVAARGTAVASEWTKVFETVLLTDMSRVSPASALSPTAKPKPLGKAQQPQPAEEGAPAEEGGAPPE